MKRLLIIVALVLSLATPVAADTYRVFKSSVSTIVTNVNTGETTVIYGDTDTEGTVVIVKED